ncbi:Zn-ribbon domain-containing OB-fold protein [Desulfofundulus sp. TPOSR]|uniref:Zn-ribbon domain-containing OB-fold protein n=1 Tax=Desulfofundulus sp. TPOSR TaxID=2714340 RepID=UPI00140A5916|nr:Zn-ribbon domain-containing OB-fold protein [Desulfofundulus sp. TPOSR]NHM28766.1 Zn-ribbon domain-containing OB-fold protein [Desulfofundulus sp. TPOSR]
MGAHISLPAYTRSISERYQLTCWKCKECGTYHFPPPTLCTNCSAREFEQVVPSGRGKIYSFTWIAAGGAPGEYAEQVKLNGSYGVALVDLEEGVRVMGQLTDCDLEEVKIGQEVQMVFRVLYSLEGVIRYGFKFKPV